MFRKKWFITFFIPLWLCLWGVTAVAQAQQGNDQPPSNNQDIRFNYLTADDGLSHNGVYTIVQDHAGFLWIGTVDGLNRYDGYDFTVYKPDYEDPNSIGDSNVRALLVDKIGNIWIATRLDGLNKFDPVTQTFSEYKHDPDDPESLTAGPVLSLYEDRSGIIWVGTQQGLNSLDPSSEKFTHYPHNPDDPKSISHNIVRWMYEDEDGVLWFGTQGSGLNTLDRKSGEFRNYQHDPDDKNSLCDDRIWMIMEDSFGEIWLGTQGGLYAFNPETGSGTCYRHDPDDSSSLGNDLVKAIYEDSRGSLWVGTWGGGLNLFDRNSGEFIRYIYNPSNLSSLANDKVSAIFEDEGSVLWVGTWGGGLNKFDPTQQRFTRIMHKPGIPNSLNNNIVYSVCETRNGRILIGTEDALNMLDQSSDGFVHFLDDSNDPNTINVGEAVHAVYEDSNGMLWAGSWAEGLNRYVPETGDFKHYRHNPDDPKSIQSDVILRIYEDSYGTLWIGTLYGGLNKFDRQTESFQSYKPNPTDPYSISDDQVFVIYEDQSDLLWLGTGAGGLNWFDRETDQFGSLRHDPDDPESLSADKINTIYQDTSGVLWIGTPNGLNKLIFNEGKNLQDVTFKRYTEKDGLPSTVVQSILEDDRGHLWLGTTRGISRFDPQSEVFKNYNVTDGLSGDEFKEGAAVRLSSGEMLFGGGSGLTLFDPDTITDSPYIPPIKITDIKILNQSLGLGGDSPLQQSIWETEALSLTQEDKVLTLEFAALSYANPDKNLLQYKMEGFDDDWSPPSRNRSATYTNLDPGDYVFYVRGSNSDGVWNEEGTSLRITIPPPWWETTWFRLLALALIVGVLVGSYRWRVRSVETRHRLLEEEVASKTRDLQKEISEHEETEGRLRKTRDELATLMTVSQDIVSTLELNPLLDLILDQLQGVVNYDGAAIVTVENELFIFRNYQGLPLDADLLSLQIPIEAISPMRRVIVEHKPFIIIDVRREPGLPLELVQATGFDVKALFGEAHAWMCVPMIVSDKAIGLLGLTHQEPGFFKSGDVGLAQAFANQAAIALENALLYEQAQAAAVAEERNRLARDLHDSVTQSLYSAILLAEVLPGINQRNPDEAARGLLELQHLTRGALSEMRTMLLELRPETLTKTPLGDLLEQLVEALTSRVEIEIELNIQPVPHLPPNVHINYYRVAQEALNNVVKHSEANQLSVTLEPSPPFSAAKVGAWHGQVELNIQDNGKGFDPEQIPPNTLGLGIMRERAAEIGAIIAIKSRPGRGTKITLIWEGSTDSEENARG